MKIKSFSLLLLMLIALACTGGKKDVGSACESDADCKGGICLDFSQADDGCTGKVCTMPCTKNADCPKVADQPDCDPVQGKSLCLYGGWEKKFCKK